PEPGRGERQPPRAERQAPGRDPKGAQVMTASVIEAKTHYDRAKSAVKSAAQELGPVLTATLLVAPVVAAGLFYVWTRVATLRLGYELSKAGEVHRALI